jgi:hypothetical protein
MATISVPTPPASAYNPKRRASQLLKDQVMHLEWAVRPASERKPADFDKIKPPKTEAEAAARIESLTRRLHPEGAQAEGARRKLAVAAPKARARGKRKARKKRTKRTARKARTRAASKSRTAAKKS